MKPHLRTRPHVVYRCYSEDGALLYVGVTHTLEKRLREHRSSAASYGMVGSYWWLATARVTVEGFATGDEAAQAELAVIAAERPLFNVQGAGRSASREVAVEPHVPEYQPKHARPAA